MKTQPNDKKSYPGQRARRADKRRKTNPDR